MTVINVQQLLSQLSRPTRADHFTSKKTAQEGSPIEQLFSEIIVSYQANETAQQSPTAFIQIESETGQADMLENMEEFAAFLQEHSEHFTEEEQLFLTNILHFIESISPLKPLKVESSSKEPILEHDLTANIKDSFIIQDEQKTADGKLKELLAKLESLLNNEAAAKIPIESLEKLTAKLQQLDHEINTVEQLVTKKEMSQKAQWQMEFTQMHPVKFSLAGHIQASLQQESMPVEQPQSTALLTEGSNQPVLSFEAEGTKEASEKPVVRIEKLFEDLKAVINGKMQIKQTGDASQIRIQLAPENLGQLEIRVASSEGKMIAQLFTSTSAAKELLELQVSQLRAAFVQQGIAVDRIEITEQPPSQQSSLQQHQHSERQFEGQFKQNSHSKKRNGYALEEEPQLQEGKKLLGESQHINFAI